MSNVEFVKYCPLCQAENPRQAPFCLECMDGDLSSVPAEPRRKVPPRVIGGQAADEEEASTAQVELEAPTTPLVCQLTLVEDPCVTFTIGDGQTVGRTNKADVVLSHVPKSDWISGIHAKFFRRNDQWYVQHLAQTNFIKVDGDTFRGQEEVAIYDGSIIVLSLTSFRVTVR